MIKARNARQYCCEDISLIENYERAVTDTENIWDCHHRGEILPCGVYSVSDLKKFDLYWNRPAWELIFLPHEEHIRLHNKTRKFSEETRRKISKAKKGNKCCLGRKLSDETKKKISEANKGERNSRFGKKHSSESKKKMAEARRRYWSERRKSV